MSVPPAPDEPDWRLPAGRGTFTSATDRELDRYNRLLQHTDALSPPDHRRVTTPVLLTRPASARFDSGEKASVDASVGELLGNVVRRARVRGAAAGDPHLRAMPPYKQERFLGSIDDLDVQRQVEVLTSKATVHELLTTRAADWSTRQGCAGDLLVWVGDKTRDAAEESHAAERRLAEKSADEAEARVCKGALDACREELLASTGRLLHAGDGLLRSIVEAHTLEERRPRHAVVQHRVNTQTTITFNNTLAAAAAAERRKKEGGGGGSGGGGGGGGGGEVPDDAAEVADEGLQRLQSFSDSLEGGGEKGGGGDVGGGAAAAAHGETRFQGQAELERTIRQKDEHIVDLMRRMEVGTVRHKKNLMLLTSELRLRSELTKRAHSELRIMSTGLGFTGDWVTHEGGAEDGGVADVAQLMAQLRDEVTGSANSDRERLESLEQSTRVLQAQLDFARADADREKGELTERVRELERLRSEALKEVAQGEEELAGARTRCNALEDELDGLETRCAAALRDHGAATKALQSVGDELDQMRAERAYLVTPDDLELKMEVAREKLLLMEAEKDAEISELRRNLSEVERTLTQKFEHERYLRNEVQQVAVAAHAEAEASAERETSAVAAFRSAFTAAATLAHAARHPTPGEGGGATAALVAAADAFVEANTPLPALCTDEHRECVEGLRRRPSAVARDAAAAKAAAAATTAADATPPPSPPAPVRQPPPPLPPPPPPGAAGSGSSPTSPLPRKATGGGGGGGGGTVAYLSDYCSALAGTFRDLSAQKAAARRFDFAASSIRPLPAGDDGHAVMAEAGPALHVLTKTMEAMSAALHKQQLECNGLVQSSVCTADSLLKTRRSALGSLAYLRSAGAAVAQAAALLCGGPPGAVAGSGPRAEALRACSAQAAADQARATGYVFRRARRAFQATPAATAAGAGGGGSAGGGLRGLMRTGVACVHDAQEISLAGKRLANLIHMLEAALSPDDVEEGAGGGGGDADGTQQLQRQRSVVLRAPPPVAVAATQTEEARGSHSSGDTTGSAPPTLATASSSSSSEVEVAAAAAAAAARLDLETRALASLQAVPPRADAAAAPAGSARRSSLQRPTQATQATQTDDVPNATCRLGTFAVDPLDAEAERRRAPRLLSRPTSAATSRAMSAASLPDSDDDGGGGGGDAEQHRRRMIYVPQPKAAYAGGVAHRFEKRMEVVLPVPAGGLEQAGGVDAGGGGDGGVRMMNPMWQIDERVVEVRSLARFVSGAKVRVLLDDPGVMVRAQVAAVDPATGRLVVALPSHEPRDAAGLLAAAAAGAPKLMPPYPEGVEVRQAVPLRDLERYKTDLSSYLAGSYNAPATRPSSAPFTPTVVTRASAGAKLPKIAFPSILSAPVCGGEVDGDVAEIVLMNRGSPREEREAAAAAASAEPWRRDMPTLRDVFGGPLPSADTLGEVAKKLSASTQRIQCPMALLPQRSQQQQLEQQLQQREKVVKKSAITM